MEWPYATPGIPDEAFERLEDIPMTKEEIRALALSKARVRRGGTFLDVGSGTGSVTVEAALLVGPGGRVYAVERDARAVELTRRNAERFGVSDRVVIIHGEAPEALAEVPRGLDSAFIGGGSERMREIVEAVFDRLRPGGRVVIDAIVLESAVRAVEALRAVGATGIEVVEAIIARGMPTRVGVAMIARNPIFVVVGEKPK